MLNRFFCVHHPRHRSNNNNTNNNNNNNNSRRLQEHQVHRRFPNQQQREEEGEELEVVKMRTVMVSGVRKMVAVAARRMGRSRKASWSLEGAAVVSCRPEVVGPFSES